MRLTQARLLSWGCHEHRKIFLWKIPAASLQCFDICQTPEIKDRKQCLFIDNLYSPVSISYNGSIDSAAGARGLWIGNQWEYLTQLFY